MDDIEKLRSRVRTICREHSRSGRVRRLFLGETAYAFRDLPDREFRLKSDISKLFDVPYSHIYFAGSGQLGFSVHKDRLFSVGDSDLDAACVDAELFQAAWVDIMTSTRAFSDLTVFGSRSETEIKKFKDQILCRGMIMVDAMPKSELQRAWSHNEAKLSKSNTDIFSRITIAIYINEYAFCWKKDSCLSQLVRN